MQPDPPQGDPRSDAELISSVRSGDPLAFGILYSRHIDATTSMARYYAKDHFSADDLVSEAFERTYATLRAGGGPDVSFRAYVYTAVRRLAYEITEKGRRTHVTDDFSAWEMPDEVTDPAVDSFENQMVASAFAGLPERWQAVLWYLEVEGMKPPEVAPLLGLTANGVSALAYRAREGLREAYLQAHISSDARDPECDRLRGKLGAYVNGTLAPRDATKVENHTRDCEECGAIVRELRDEGHGLRVIIAPLILGGAAAAGLLAGGRPMSASAAPAAGAGRRIAPAALVAAAVLGIAAIAGIAGILSLVSAPTDPTTDPTVPVVAEAPSSPPASPPPATTSEPVTTPTPRPTRTTPTPPTPEPSPTPAIPATVTVEVQDVGDLVLGRDGMVGATITVADATATDATVRFDLPEGITFDASRQHTAANGWSCSAAETVVTCSAASVPADTTATVFIPVTVADTATIGATPTVTAWATGTKSASSSAAGVVAAGLGTRYLADGRYATTLAGASFLSCDPALAGCVDARNRTGNPALWDNQSWTLVALDEVGEGDVSAVTNLELPSGAEVVYAGLYWSADTPAGETDAQVGALDLRSPSGADTSVIAQHVDHATFAGTDRYQAFADVTNLVAAGGAGQWAASAPRIGPGTAPGAGGTVPANTHAGWSLVVVYAHPDAVDGRVTVFDGFQVVNETATTFTVAGLPGRDVSVGVVAWEGDAGLTGDGVTGADVGSFLPAPLTHSRASVTASTAGDQYAIGVVTVSTR
jgi:RNA polymerase sigma factor (sigma-70 family)